MLFYIYQRKRPDSAATLRARPRKDLDMDQNSRTLHTNRLRRMVEAYRAHNDDLAREMERTEAEIRIWQDRLEQAEIASGDRS